MKGTRTPAPHNRAVKLALASASLLSLSAVPAIVHADSAADASQSTSGVYVTILSPNPGTDLTGKKQVEISAYYESSFGVSSVDLFIDGQRMATQHLSSAESRGEISFVVDPTTLQPGNHAIVVRATATDEEVASARTVLNLPTVTTSVAAPVTPTDTTNQAPDSSTQTDVAGAPTIQIVSPSASDSVQGVVQIKVNAVDASGKPPYVSLFIDRSFKTLRNFAPYTFDWDTTKLPNGPHLIEVFGYNDAQQVGHATPVRVNVNNPSGHTFVRHDLSDFAPITTTPNAKLDVLTTSHKATAADTRVAKAKTSRRAGQPKLAFDFLNSVVPHLVASDQEMARLDLNDSSLSAGTLPDGTSSVISQSDLAAMNQAAAQADVKSASRAASVVRRASANNVPHLRSTAAIASEMSTLVGIQSKDQLDNLGAVPLDSSLAAGDLVSDGSVAPIMPKAVVVTRRASSHAVPSLVGKRSDREMQIASAKIGGDSFGNVEPNTVPKVDLNEIERQATQIIPQLESKMVNVKELSTRDMHRLAGSYDVVVDDQRVALAEPLQERGALLYAPMRQIFETQGGQLAWDQTKHQVSAFSTAGEVVLRIGSHHAIVNNRAVKMQGAAYLLNNRTMLPVDFYATAMNANVSFDPESGHLVIESKDN